MTKFYPKISIITPSFNQGLYLEESIASIVNQSYNNFELIIIDGGSSDNSTKILEKYSKKISYWISESDKGQSHAINKGLKYANGEIVTWLNSDDYYEPKTLETVAKLFQENPEAEIIHGKAKLFGKNKKSKIIGLNNDIAIYEYLPYMRFPQPSSFLKRKLLSKDYPLNLDLHYSMDFELMVRSILKGCTIKRVDGLLSNYRLHETSKTNEEVKFLNEWTQIVHKIFNSLSNGLEYSQKLEELGLIKNPRQDKFETCVNFKNDELESVFLQHLHFHYHYHYRNLNHSDCNKISDFLKSNYRNHYLNSKYGKFNLRRKFIPDFLFRLKNTLR